MTHRLRLNLSSLTFAALWVCMMTLTMPTLKIEQIGMLTLSGALAGLAWHWACSVWLRWRLFPRKRAS
jgi:hypothetical protein